MSKIICDICGTSYSETSQQCPICGCVRPGDVQRVTNEVKTEGNTATGYTHVKGGHFSKSNVKKRNRKAVATEDRKKPEQKPAAQEKVKEQKPAPKKQNKKSEKKSNVGLVITAVLLLLAIIAVVIFIAVRFFGPMITPPTDPTENQTTGGTEGKEILCTDIKLDIETVTFQQEGDARLLSVTRTPANTTDIVTFRSENEAIATVTADGKVTAVAKGETKIIITCGSVVKECKVVCDIPDVLCQNLVLNFETVTLEKAGDFKQLQVTIEPANAVETATFRSANEAIATVTADGKITAVAKGETKIIITCGNVVKECIVICDIEDEQTTEPTRPPETIHFNRTDFTLFYEGDSWILYDGTVAKNLVTFISDNASVATFVDGKVVAVSPGLTTVYAIYGDQKISCIVRCSFEQSGGVGGNGGVGEDGEGTGNVTYAINSQYGKIYDRYSENGWEITIKAGDIIYLYLKDSNGNTVVGTWTITGDCCTLADNKITGVTSGGVAIVSITHNEKTYTCKVHVS